MTKRLFYQQSEPGSRIAATAQRLSVKARIMMALFALMLIPQGTWAQYYLKIGNQEFSGSGITDLSALSEFAGVITDGSVVYNHNSHTLSLNGATISGNIVWNYQDNLNIELEGDNVLTGRIIANNSYTLTFIKSSASTGNCSLTISSGAVAAATSAISGFSDVWYKHVYLDSAYPVAYDGSQMKMLDYQYPNSPSDASSISLKSDHVYHRIWVNGTQLTDLNLSPMAPNLVYSGSPDSDDGGTRTLTLNNYTANGSIVSDLPNLTIQFVGTNKINTDGQSNSSFGAADNAIFSCNPSATLTFQKNGDGTLELDGKDTPKSAIAGFASVNYGDGCYLKADKPTKYSSDDKCYINFANGNAPVDVVTISTDVYYPLWIGTSTTNATQVATTTITAGVTAGTVTFTPAIGTTSSKLSLSGVTLTGKILSALGDLVIEVSGENTISSPDSGTVIRSANAGTLTLERAASIASLELKTNLTDNTKPVIQGFHTLSYNTSFDLNTSATTPTYGIFYSMYGLFDDGPGGIFAIMQATFAKNYGLSIAGTPVTSANAGNVFSGDATNDGKVTFTPDATTANSGTLTLNGFEKTDANAAIVSGLDNLTIEFSGANEIGATSGWDGFVKSTNTNATLTFKGGAANSTLVLHGSDTTNDAVVEGFKSVSYDGAYWNYSDPITYDATTRQYRSQNSRDNFMLNYVVITTTPQYLLWLGATQVSDANKDNILNESTATASYNVTDNILTLDDCNFHSMNGLMCGLNSLTISLKGSNTIAADYYSNYSALYSSVSTATLNIQRADGENNCSLVLGTMGNTPVVKGFASVSYPDLELNVTAGTGTTIDAATTYGAKLSVSAYPLWIGNTQVNVANAGNVLSGTANDGKVSYVHDATNNTGTLTLNNAQLVGDIATSMSDLTIHIKGGCQIIAKSNCIRSSATTPGTLTFTREGAGDLTLNNINAVDPYNPSNTKMTAIKGFKTLAGLPLITKEPYEIDAYCRLKKSMSSDTATIDYAWVNADVAYPLWVGDKQVTSENKTNVLEAATPTVTFDGANTLTLDGVILSDSIVSDLASLTIGLIGDNRISKGIRSSKATTSLTIAKDATATGNVSLLVETPYAYAIWGFNSLTYTGFTPYTSDGTLDLTSTISYTSTDRALKNGGSKLDGVKFVSKTDLSASGFSFSMDSKTYSGSAVVLPGNVTMNDGTNNIPLTATSDYTVTGYKDANGNSLTSGAPTDAGSYYATISGEGVYTGTADVPFTINPITASLSWDTTTPLTYNGTPQAPAVSVSNLLSGESCTVTVTGQQTNAGTSYTATATGLGNSNYQLPTTGLTQTFNIDQLDLSTSTTLSIGTIDNQTYSGANIEPKPAVSITLGTSTTPTTLKAEDFDYSYANNKNAALSTATPAPTVTITGKGNYKGSSSKTFTILPKSVEGLTVTLSGTGFDSDKKSFVYNGQMQTPTVTVKDGDKLLVLNTDYTLVNNGGVGAADDYDVVVTGTGNYDSNTSVTVTYSIAPKSIASAVITLSSTSSAFNGDTQVPTISSVSLDNVPLTPDVDYTVKSNAGGKDVGTYDVVIQGKGNYDAATTAQKTFTIVPCSVAVVTIDAIPAQTYNGLPITPVPTGFIMSGANKISLVVGTDFDCTSYANNTNAALSTDTPAPTVTITCKGNYYGTRNVPFTIDPVDLSKSTDITIDAVPDQIYTGSPITPTPEVKFNGNKLTAGTDFNYSYSNNTDEAQSTSSPAPTVTVTGMGNFKNSTSVKFTIEQEASIAFGTRNYITYYNEYAGNRLVPNNAKAYIVTGVNGNEVVVDQVSFITPFTPVLLEKSPGWTNVKDNVLHSGNLLKYATADVNTDGKQYVLYSGEFVKATGTIPAGKVYLELPSSPARTLVIGRNNAATGVDTISNEAADGEDKWYDMQGRQINKPSKTGLYIKNGKKVVVNNK
ncbi:MAG: hypothetical protein J5502_04310 [Prevotella sp.]|nr:hypothetical protein [Prevotella sp.]